MKRYAMVLQNERRVIEIIESEEIPYFPPTQDDEEIEAIECNNPEVERGYWYYIDEEFKYIEPTYVEPELEEPTQLDIIEMNSVATAVNTEYIACMMEING